jgi:hypothetical protein
MSSSSNIYDLRIKSYESNSGFFAISANKIAGVSHQRQPYGNGWTSHVATPVITDLSSQKEGGVYSA